MLGIVLNDIKTLDAFVDDGKRDVPHHIKNTVYYKELNRSRIENHSIGFKDNFKELHYILNELKLNSDDLNKYIDECLNKLK